MDRGPYEDFLLNDGILMKRVKGTNLIVLSTCMYIDVIREIHDQGHFGVKKMTETINKEYYIPNLTARLENYISCFVLCLLAEKRKGKHKGILTPISKGD